MLVSRGASAPGNHAFLDKHQRFFHIKTLSFWPIVACKIIHMAPQVPTNWRGGTQACLLNISQYPNQVDGEHLPEGPGGSRGSPTPVKQPARSSSKWATTEKQPLARSWIWTGRCADQSAIILAWVATLIWRDHQGVEGCLCDMVA